MSDKNPLAKPGQKITIEHADGSAPLTYEVVEEFDFIAEKIASQNKTGDFPDAKFQVECFMIELTRRGLVKPFGLH